MKFNFHIFHHTVDQSLEQRLDHLQSTLETFRSAIMSKISEFADKVTAHNDKIDAALEGINGDVVGLKALIEQLQNSAGEVTPEDQALLDQLEARLAALADKTAALDELTPPVAPPG